MQVLVVNILIIEAQPFFFLPEVYKENFKLLYALKNNAVLLLSITHEKQLNKILVKLSKKKNVLG